MLSDYGDDDTDCDEYEMAHIFFHKGDMTDNRKYVVGEKLAKLLAVNVGSRHSVKNLVDMITDYVEKHAGTMKRKYNIFLNFDASVWDALNRPYNKRIKMWELKFFVERCVSYPEPFPFEWEMKIGIWNVG